jgi:hypothetical protein
MSKFGSIVCIKNVSICFELFRNGIKAGTVLADLVIEPLLNNPSYCNVSDRYDAKSTVKEIAS